MQSTIEPLNHFRQERQRISQLPTEERPNANKALLKERADWVQTAIAQHYQLTLKNPQEASWLWFWFNHFNVFWRKGAVGATLNSYLSDALAPHLTGSFETLLYAIITHPAMLIYLDNGQNVKGKLNENLARELLELHTLGSAGGYSQTDVQAVAHILTGLGVVPVNPEARDKALSAGGIEQGMMLFDPRKHDSTNVIVMGKSFETGGFEDIKHLIHFLAHSPATTKHLAQQICFFWLGESVNQATIQQVAQVWQDTQGDLDKVFAYLQQIHSKHATPTFKDPHRYLLSSLRILSLEKRLQHPEKVSAWLTQLGQPLFACLTPNGYTLKGSDWQSSGQLTQRFDIANELVEALPRIFGHSPELVWQSEYVQTWLAQHASAQTQHILQHTPDISEKLVLLLSSPEWMYGLGWGETA